MGSEPATSRFRGLVCVRGATSRLADRSHPTPLRLLRSAYLHPSGLANSPALRPHIQAAGRASFRAQSAKAGGFPFWFGEAGPVSRWVMPLRRQIMSNSTSPLRERASRTGREPFPVIGENLLGTPNRSRAWALVRELILINAAPAEELRPAP
jgi:hypothetical protein